MCLIAYISDSWDTASRWQICQSKPQCSCVATGTYRLLCFLKARGKRGKAHKSDGIKWMKGDSVGFNGSFLWPEASLNSCRCRRILYCGSSIHATFPVDCDMTFARSEPLPTVVCLLSGIRMKPTDPGRHKKMWSSFLKPVIPCNSSAPSQTLFFPNNGRQVSLSIWQVGGWVGRGGFTNVTGCSTSWKCGPMGPFYVTLSNCHFDFGKCT